MIASTIRVLVVDDEPNLLEISKEFLELDNSISADTTSSAYDALKQIELHNYDAIVSDYQMPGKDGVQLLKEIRETGNKVPFIIFTGKGREDVVIEALNAGANYYLQKGGDPIAQFAELENMIKQAYAKAEGERALQISEERYRSLFENSTDAVILTTSDFDTILFANPSACTMFQMTEDQVRKLGIRGLVIDEKEWEKEHRILKQTGIVRRKFTYRRKDGATFTGETTSGLLTGHYGLARISMIVRDVTEQEKADEIIPESEARFRTYIDNAPEGIFVVDSEGNYQDVNRTSCSMLGYSREDLLNMNLVEITEPSMVQDSLKMFKLLQEKGSMTMETVLMRKDGTKIPIFLNAVGLPNQRYMAFCTDIAERKWAEKAAQENELHYRSLFDNTLEGVAVHKIILDSNGVPCDYQFLEINPAFEKMTGLVRKDTLGKTVCEVIPNIEQTLIECYGKVALTGVPDHFEDYVEALDTVFEIFVYRNAPMQFTTNFNDVTERRRAEVNLGESEERLRDFIDETPAGYFFVDNEGRFKSVNSAWLRMHGYESDEEIIGQNFSITQPDDGIEYAEKVVKEVLNGEEIQSGEAARKCKDGSIRFHVYSAHPVWMKGEIIGLEGFLVDNTEHRRAEGELKKSESQLNTLLHTIPDLVWLKDNNGVYLSCNPSFERFLGAKESDIVGKTDYDFMERDLADSFHRNDRNAIAAGKPTLNEEWIIFKNDGHPALLETTKTPMFDAQCKIIGVLGIGHDITNRKYAEDALKLTNKKLNLLSSITRHDINGQLMALEGNLTLLQRKHNELGTDDHFLKAELAAKRISAMIQFTKEYENIGINAPSWQNVYELVNKASEIVHLGKIRFVNNIPAGTEVFADPLIAKVLHNLIDNAVRHGEKTTTLHFDIKDRGGSQAIICEDDGVGILPEMKKGLFTHTSNDNHGFGLALSREILAITGMTITEEGELGKGACFVIIVPHGGIRTV